MTELSSALGSSPSFPAVLQEEPVENEKIYLEKAKWESVCSLKNVVLVSPSLRLCVLSFYYSEKGIVLVKVHCVQSLGKENKL